MIRKRHLKDFSKFPEPAIEKEKVLTDIREREYMSKFKEFHVRTVFYLALLGMTEQQMSCVFDISMAVFQQWKSRFPSFLEALHKGKEQADASVVYSLYQSAVGYEHASEQIFLSKEKEYDSVTGKLVRETAKIVRVPVIKKYPPSVKAAMHWLAVRQPAQWSSRTDVHAKLTVNQTNYDFHGLSLEELKVLQKITQQQTNADDAQYTSFTTTTQDEMKDSNV